jgi:hypothetical protein
VSAVLIYSHDQELQATHSHSLVTESFDLGHYNQIHLQLKAMMLVAGFHFDLRTNEQLLLRLEKDSPQTAVEVFVLADHQ